jgi:solute:Na+ symporter, SSS family
MHPGRRWLCLVLVGLLVLQVADWCAAEVADSRSGLAWEKLPPLPDEFGFAGPFAGVSGNALVVAGGANFPDGPPWRGGTKIWHDRIFVLRSANAQWTEVEQRLPRPLGYGVSITVPDGIICIGGSDAQQHHRDVFKLKWNGKAIEVVEMPPLPQPLANMCGAIVGSTIYVAGGTEAPDSREATKHFWALNTANNGAQWTQLEPWPGPERMLSVAAVQSAGDKPAFFVVSGTRLVPDGNGGTRREYLTDGYRYLPGEGWGKIADVPTPVVAAPSPAPAIGGSHFLVFGGDSGADVNFEPKDQHPGFSTDTLEYHTITDTWVRGTPAPAGHVTTAVVPWTGGYVIPTGETRPAVRSPDVLLMKSVPAKAGFGVINYISLTIYLLGVVAVGLYFVRRNKNTDQFFRGGQRIPWWAAGLSIYATMLSSITYMAVPARAYATDWTFFMNALGIFLVAPIVIYAYLPFFRQLNVTSAYEYLEKRFSLAVRLFGSASFILLQVGRMAIVLYLPALALATVSALDIYTCIVIMGVLCILYTMMGGIEAVIWTDVIQTFVLAAGALLAFSLIVMRTDGGVVDLFVVAHAHGKFFENASFGWDTAAATATVVLVGSMFSNLVPYTAQQDVVQRYVTTKDQARAAKSIWINAFISVPSSAMFFLVGTALFVFYKAHPERLDPALPTDSVFPQFIVRELPAGVAGIVVAGVFAAAQSTLSSSLNSIATAYVTDFHRRFKPATSDSGDLLIARLVTLLLGVVGILSACWLASTDVKFLWDAFLKLLGLTGGALAGLFALGIFTTRATGPGALVGAVVSAITLYFVQRSPDVSFLLYGAIGIIVCFVAGYLASLVLPGSGRTDLAGLTLFTRGGTVQEPVPAVQPGQSPA